MVDHVDNKKTTAVAWDGATSDADYDALKGKVVLASDDFVVGTVSAVFHPAPEDGLVRGAHYVLVEPSNLTGPGGAGPLYMPEAAIGEVGADGIRIAWTRDELENQGWASKPALIDDYRRV